MSENSAYVSKLERTIEQQNQLIEDLRHEVENLNEIVGLLKKQCFGSSSEKVHNEDNSEQLSIFNEAEQEYNPKAEEPAFTSVKGHARLKKSSRKDQILKELPVKEIICDMTDEEKFCENCGTPLKYMGRETIREEIEFIPASLRVLRYVRMTYECPKCKHTDDPYIVASLTPTSLMNHSLASPSSVAQVMYQKYVNSVPLYRQEKDWEQMGLILSRTTMANWVIRCSEDYFAPLIERFRAEILNRDVVHVDETPVQVLKEQGKKPQSKSYMWLYTTGNDGLAPVVIYDYKPNRSGDNAVSFLEGFRGYVHSDGFSGYNKLEGVTRCGCWAHLRRKFHEAVPQSKANGTSPSVAEVGRDYCNQLFNIEHSLKELPSDERYIRRLELEKPVLEAFWRWLDVQMPLGGSRLDKAIHYAREQKPYLENYLNDGRCSISNNTAENAIRPFTVGRKNWLFSDTPKGAEASAAVYSIVETAKANGLNIFVYLKYILQRMPDCDWRIHPEELEDLMPWSESVKTECSR